MSHFSTCFVLLIFLSFFEAHSETRFTHINNVNHENENLTQIVFEHVFKNTFKLESDSGTCSATQVIKPGLFLTARHCLNLCLIQSKAVQAEQSSGSKNYPINLFKRQTSMLGNAHCQVSLNGRSLEISIEDLGPGFLTEFERRSLKMMDFLHYQNLNSFNYFSTGDFVFFKLINKNSIELPNRPMQLNEDTLDQEFTAYDNRLYVFSYPALTIRPDGFNSDGESLFFSSGEWISFINEISCLNEITPSNHKLQDLRLSFESPGTQLSTLDAHFGSSGSLAFNNKGEGIGLLINQYNHQSVSGKPEDSPTHRYCRGSALILKLNHIKHHWINKCRHDRIF